MDIETQQKYKDQAEMLVNRVKKKFKHIHKRFLKQNIDVFRLYDWDIPEIRAVVDWYAGHLVVGEYTRKQTTAQWLPMMGEALSEAFGIPMDHVHLKQRVVGKNDGQRYERIANTNQNFMVSERDLKFYVNPYDFIDTGLFSDHRNTRQMIREMARGKKFLNLYCYTGTFTCYAAKGGASQTTSVDRSETAISWARKNLLLNQFSEAKHQLIQAHTFEFLKNFQKKMQKYELAVVDPPSFSTRQHLNQEFDIVKDHPILLKKVIDLMHKGGIIFFSTNHQNFVPKMDYLKISQLTEITSSTIPEDYASKRKMIHRCWKLVV